MPTQDSRIVAAAFFLLVASAGAQTAKTKVPAAPPAKPAIKTVPAPVAHPVIVQPAQVKTVQPAQVKTVQPPQVKTVQPVQPAQAKTAQPVQQPVRTGASPQTAAAVAPKTATAAAVTAQGASVQPAVLTNTVPAGTVPATNATQGTTHTNPVMNYLNSGGAGSSGQGYSQGGGMSGAAANNIAQTSTAQGYGTFLAGDWTMTSYPCMRSNTRVFCDFDLTKTNAGQIGPTAFWDTSMLIDGGQVLRRHTGFFVGADGSEFQTGYVSATQPLRYVMEYDDVPMSVSAVTLVYGSNKIQGVGIMAMNDTQAAGTMPLRGAPGTASQTQAAAVATAAPVAGAVPAADGSATGQAQPAAPASATDKASNTINKVNNGKAKALSLWQQMKTVTAKQ